MVLAIRPLVPVDLNGTLIQTTNWKEAELPEEERLFGGSLLVVWVTSLKVGSAELQFPG